MEGLSAKKIAAEVGCGLTTIKDHLRKYGLTKGGRGTAKHKAKLAYGKKLVKGQIKSHCRETDTIESIKDMYSKQGHTPTAIARILNTMKVPTKKRGKKWDHSVIIDILKREGLYKVTRKSPKPRED